MAQGQIKKASKPVATKKTTGPTHGNRVIKPKKQHLIKQVGIKRKAAAGLSGSTEKMLGEKAGHLELLKGGKRDKRDARIANAAKKEAKMAKSG